MKKLTNDEKIKRVEKRKVLKVFIIILAILTILFSILTLIIETSPIFACFFFVLEIILNKYRESLDPKKEVHKKWNVLFFVLFNRIVI